MNKKVYSYVPMEKVTQVIENKYEAIVVAAREARKINSVLRMVGRDENLVKVTSRALRRVSVGDIDYVYLDDAPETDVPEVKASPENTNHEEKPAAG